MKRLCYLYKIYANIAFQIFLTILLWGVPSYGIYVTFAILLNTGCMVYFFYKFQKTLQKASSVCEEIRLGNFEARIKNHVVYGPSRGYLNSINNTIDICDAFVRESYLVMRAASEGRYHRKIRQEGMRGAFAASVKAINDAVDILNQKATQEHQQTAMMSEAIHELSNLISDALCGILTTRMDATKYEKEFKDIAEQTNKLMDAIQVPLNHAIELMNYLSKGDLTHIIEAQYQGSFGEMKEALNATTFSLKETVNSIKTSAYHVSSSAQKISTGGLDLSQRTEAQASGLEQTAASVESISQTLRQNTGVTKEAAKKALDAKDKALQGGDIVKQAIFAMERIAQSSKEITTIIETINEISFQTNILALNASIEAARAGEHGRGFDVVAGEVRALAARSSSSAQEIQERIQNSINLVTEGVDLVNQAGVVLEDIVTSNNQLSENIQGIVESSIAQSSSIEEISAATNHMDAITQKNAALVQESTAAAQTLSSHANELYTLMEKFKVDDSSPNYKSKENSMSSSSKKGSFNSDSNQYQPHP
jgi:methyl-accepting chemotaxis protein